MTYFDQDGRPTAVDTTHPVELMEPEEESPDRGMPPLIKVVDFVARTFLAGDPKITHVAWRILLGDEWDAIRACARRSPSNNHSRWWSEWPLVSGKCWRRRR